MKKLLSIILSAIMAVSVMAMATVPAMAYQSPQSTTHARVLGGEVNGSTSSDVTYLPDQNNPNKVTFTYTGNKDLIRWEFPGMQLGSDYEVVSEDGNSITIVILNANIDAVANAIVEGDETTKKPNKDNGNKSPNTGAMIAAGVAVAGAGIAILAAIKKDEDAE